MKLLYVYGISKGILEEKVNINTESISDNNSVNIFNCNEIQAIYSTVMSSEFDAENLVKNFKDMVWISKKAFAHENVITELMKKYPIIPMRFCTIYNNTESLESFLSKYHSNLLVNIELAEKNEEWGLKIFYNCDIIKNTIEKRDNFQKEKKDISSKSKGLEYLLKKRYEQKIADQVEVVVNETIQNIYDKIKNFSKDVIVKTIAKTDNVNIICAVNIIIFIEKGWRKEFLEIVKTLEYEYHLHGYSFNLKGPLPIYNHINIQEGNADGK